jgi:hypothetical protein
VNATDRWPERRVTREGVRLTVGLATVGTQAWLEMNFGDGLPTSVHLASEEADWLADQLQALAEVVRQREVPF